MSFDLIRVCVFGRGDPGWSDQVTLRDASAVEAAGFAIQTFLTDVDLTRHLVEIRPQVIVSFGRPETYQNLWRAPLEVRRRWITFPDLNVDPADVAERIIQTYITNATTDRFPEEPLVSVFTPTHLTGDKIERPLRSLLAQSYANWEWVLYDDSPDDGRTFAAISELCCRDQRIAAYRAHRASGRIGEVKRRACGLARGSILVELDHDDELTPDALGHVIEAHRAYPDAGFFYTDCAEVFESGENATYGDSWGFGYGSYREEWLNGRTYMVTNAPDINSKTIRHIVSVPNHIRAWTREAYQASGGHNPDVHVCDDYELVLRTFLTTRMVHIQRFGYIQYFNNSSSGNTQWQRNTEIQRLVKYFRARYEAQIHERFVELGVDDFIWRPDGWLDWETPNPADTPIANYRFA
jgi:glycosyltransferase involved in cell wall biosynthesis